jgi:hypothetical protein
MHSGHCEQNGPEQADKGVLNTDWQLWPGIVSVAALATALTTPTDAIADTMTYRVQVSNVSSEQVSGQPWRLSPLVWLVHRQEEPLFSAGKQDRGLGLRRLAEAGQPQQLALICNSLPGVQSCGSVQVRDGGNEPGGLTPGQSFTFLVQGRPGDRLSIAGMVVPSHDTFWSTPVGGLPLANQTQRPALRLWDAGTEVDLAPAGLSSSQAPRQSYPDQGLREHRPVTPSSEVPYGRSYPAPEKLVRVTITPEPRR